MLKAENRRQIQRACNQAGTCLDVLSFEGIYTILPCVKTKFCPKEYNSRHEEDSEAKATRLDYPAGSMDGRISMGSQPKVTLELGGLCTMNGWGHGLDEGNKTTIGRYIKKVRYGTVRYGTTLRYRIRPFFRIDFTQTQGPAHRRLKPTSSVQDLLPSNSYSRTIIQV